MFDDLLPMLFKHASDGAILWILMAAVFYAVFVEVSYRKTLGVAGLVIVLLGLFIATSRADPTNNPEKPCLLGDKKIVVGFTNRRGIPETPHTIYGALVTDDVNSKGVETKCRNNIVRTVDAGKLVKGGWIRAQTANAPTYAAITESAKYDNKPVGIEKSTVQFIQDEFSGLTVSVSTWLDKGVIASLWPPKNDGGEDPEPLKAHYIRRDGAMEAMWDDSTIIVKLISYNNLNKTKRYAKFLILKYPGVTSSAR